MLSNGKSCTLQVGVTGKQSRVTDSGYFEVKTIVHFKEKIFNISIREQAGKDGNVLQSPQLLFVATVSWLLDHLYMLQLLETTFPRYFCSAKPWGFLNRVQGHCSYMQNVKVQHYMVDQF